MQVSTNNDGNNIEILSLEIRKDVVELARDAIMNLIDTRIEEYKQTGKVKLKTISIRYDKKANQLIIK